MLLDECLKITVHDKPDFGCWVHEKGRLCFRFFDGIAVNQWVLFENEADLNIIVGSNTCVKIIDNAEAIQYQILPNATVWHTNVGGNVQKFATYILQQDAKLYHDHKEPMRCEADSKICIQLMGAGAMVDWREGDDLSKSVVRKLQITIDHQAPKTQSNCLVKSVVHDAASFNFYCDVFIRDAAVGAVAHQRNLNHVLSAQGSVRTLPRLHVWNKNIEASHGAATQPIPHEAMVYLQMRGLDDQQAQRLYLAGFLKETEFTSHGDI